MGTLSLPSALSRHFAPVASLLLFMLLAAFPAWPGPLDDLPVDTRARLAVAASAFPQGEAPALDPDSPSFAPNTVASYLETNEDGNYASSTFRNGFQTYFTLLRLADEKEAAAGLEAWKATGDAAVPLDWGGNFAVFRRGQGLLGVSMLGGGTVARGQSGRWHFEVSVVPEGSGPGAETGASELAAAAEAMRVLAANAARYQLFPRELTVAFQVDGGRSNRLAAGQNFHVPLRADAETRAVFTLQVLDSGKPVERVSYAATLSGPLAAVAELERDGSRSPRSFAETSSPSGEPVALTWVFPPAVSTKLSGLIDSGDTSLSIAIEARPAPQVLP